MVHYIWVITIFFLCSLHIRIYHSRILTMRHHWQSRNAEHPFKRFLTVNQHVACGRAHKELYSRHSIAVDDIQRFSVVIGSTYEESIIYDTLLSTTIHLVAPCLNGSCLRHSVGHVEIRCHTSCGSRPTLGCDVSLVCHSWFAEMHMVVNNPGKNITTRGVSHFIN